MEGKAWFFISMILFASLLIVTFAYFNNELEIQVDQTCEDIKQIFEYEILEMEISEETNDIFDYYDFASQAYDVDNFDNVIYYCERSRDASADYSQSLREFKASIPENASDILNFRKGMIDLEIELYFALYEACEYFESAARSYDASKWASGDASIEAMNKRIDDYDNLVEDYSNLVAEYSQMKKELFSNNSF